MSSKGPYLQQFDEIYERSSWRSDGCPQIALNQNMLQYIKKAYGVESPEDLTER